MLEKLFEGEVDILRDSAQQDRRYIPPLVEGDGGGAAVWVAKLLVRAALANLLEPKGT